MNPRDILRRQEIDYPMKIRDALIHAEEAFRKKDIQVNLRSFNKICFSIAGFILDFQAFDF